ncbi:hypothetical protein KNT89_gp82 [Gordonia phage Petra]|uniref:Uncharacterized protein n=2 Tax=root TaxID=1 RepID=A0A2U8UKH2_9CAUD|nr:hypothetical protein [Gordonia westfalica]YP_010095476.1 hypothetical protein KNT89_gp82 [Gordonia phage Petra]AWN04195.1 hypothetical protein PBI_PETRA_82 [Gordonia phage Petra]SDU64798.1 hypothetical protein SAMN04488548_1342953 [Gordonia westfalica]
MKHPPAPSSAIECANIAWLASAGARATVCCTREHGHAGPHYDAVLGVEWTKEQR